MAHKILIIDDELPIREALTDKFEREDFIVYAAPNGQAGLDLALNKHPDIILLDLIMPVMDGLTTLDLLKKAA
jgi:DNA-binding response OmpR family regulator